MILVMFAVLPMCSPSTRTHPTPPLSQPAILPAPSQSIPTEPLVQERGLVFPPKLPSTAEAEGVIEGPHHLSVIPPTPITEIPTSKPGWATAPATTNPPIHPSGTTRGRELLSLMPRCVRVLTRATGQWLWVLFWAWGRPRVASRKGAAARHHNARAGRGGHVTESVSMPQTGRCTPEGGY